MIAFILSHSSPRDGMARALLGLAAALTRQGDEVIVGVPEDATSVNRYLRTEERVQAVTFGFPSRQDIEQTLSRNSAKIVVSDDYLPNLHLLSQLRANLHVKTMSYCGVFYGLSTLNPVRTRVDYPGLVIRIGRVIPWRAITRDYRRMLARVDCVLGMSRYACHLLYDLYGVESSDLIYPILGPAFRDPNSSTNARRDLLLVYAGDKTGDQEDGLNSDRVARTAEEVGLETVAFGRMGHLLAGPRVRVLGDCSDAELAKSYQRAALVYAPQKWEAFGYVGAEAVSCGAPIVLPRYQPWLEIMGPAYAPIILSRFQDLARVTTSRKDLQARADELSLHSENLRRTLSPESAAKLFTQIVANRLGKEA